MKKPVVIFLLSFFMGFYLFAQQSNLQNIQPSTDSLMKTVQYLSSPALKGRLPGTDGYEKAVQYAATKFKLYGLKEFNEISGYRQLVPIEHNQITGPCDMYVLNYKNKKKTYTHGKSYSFRGFTGSADITVPVVFCGYGLERDGFNDYTGVDVKGKAVIVFKGNPSIKGKDFGAFSIPERAETAMKKGAVALVFVPIPGSEREQPNGSMMCGRGKSYENFPMVQIFYDVAGDLLEGTGETLEMLNKVIIETGKSKSFVLPSKIHINVQAEYKPEIKAPNVIAYKEGTAFGYKEEWVLVTAHLDHVGSQCDVFYPGANDNASGSAAVLELARLFSGMDTKRGIIFALLTSEEQGLLGAQYLADHLPVEGYRIVAAFNFDCIAVGDSIQVGNGLTNPLLYDIVKDYDRSKHLVSATWKGGGADLTPFSKLEIPGLYFVSKNSYTHLHLPSDTPETFNRSLFNDIVYMGFSMTLHVANARYCREEIVKD